MPQSDVPGEKTSPTQPFPVKPPPLSRDGAADASRTDDGLGRVAPASARRCSTSARAAGSTRRRAREPTFWFPGTMGGATWSGGSLNPQLAVSVREHERCRRRRARMQPPGAPRPIAAPARWGAYARFWDSISTCRASRRRGAGCTRSIWPRATSAGRCRSATRRSSRRRGITGTGTPNIGGAIATATGLVFIAATNDAASVRSTPAPAACCWHAALPASGHATPITYRGPRRAAIRGRSPPAAAGGSRPTSRMQSCVYAARDEIVPSAKCRVPSEVGSEQWRVVAHR